MQLYNFESHDIQEFDFFFLFTVFEVVVTLFLQPLQSVLKRERMEIVQRRITGTICSLLWETLTIKISQLIDLSKK